MKLLLTSGGITNASIEGALVRLLGRPVAECNALYVPTAMHALPDGPSRVWQSLSGQGGSPLSGLGWKSVGVLELTALPSIDRDVWAQTVQDCDALLVGGGDPLYLAHWMRESGLAELFAELPEELVYVGVSAGSMVMTPRVGEDFVHWHTPGGDDTTLGLVDFSIFPHLDHPMLPENTMDTARAWAAALATSAYVIDDDTALVVTGGVVEVVSEGHWTVLPD